MGAGASTTTHTCASTSSFLQLVPLWSTTSTATAAAVAAAVAAAAAAAADAAAAAARLEQQDSQCCP